MIYSETPSKTNDSSLFSKSLAKEKYQTYNNFQKNMIPFVLSGM